MCRLPTALAAVAALVVFSATASAVVDVSGPARGVAVAPFAGASTDADEVPDIATLLAGELSARSNTRVIAPGMLLHDARGIRDPQARDVRRWAIWNQVEHVVVGRTGWRGSRGLDVAVELRSGHSGAQRAEYRLEPASVEDLPGAVTQLATLILADLGEQVVPGDESLPRVGAAAAGEAESDPAFPESAAREEDSGGDDGSLALLPGVNRDDPISINSDELEVLAQGGGRKLVFSRNVEVLQGDVTLNADRLEAIYPEGASQPDRPVATGNVRVVQGNRRARCEEATYERADGIIMCRGRAELTEGCDRVRGHLIELDLERERVRVTGAASVVIQSEGAACADESSSSGSRVR